MREDKRNESKKIILFVAITMAVFFLFPVYAYTQIGRGIERREALRAEIETHGPWWSRRSGCPLTGALMCCRRRTSRMRSPRRTSSSAANGTTLR